MNQFVKIKSNFLLLILSCISVYATENIKLSQFENNSNYFIRDIDINRDGMLDKVISSEKYTGTELYFFLQESKRYKLVLKSTNFTEDGGNIIDDITAQNKGNIVLSLRTFFPDRGNYGIVYFVSFKNNSWFLTDTRYTTSSWQNDYTKTYNCNVTQNINLENINNENWFEEIKPIPSEKERDNLCEINFYMEDTLKDFTERFKDDNNLIVKGISRYDALLTKFPLTKKEVVEYNNIAYYLEKAKAYKESAYLLEKILEKFPNRTVAYLNLGDAYWGMNNKGKAKKAYTTYIKQMKELGKEKKIPQVVLQRVK